ncbi:MAG TPA: rubrerythrin [Spirochaetes bacterium]|nr:rubrerythrin [Spirochaetota bacterium]
MDKLVRCKACGYIMKEKGLKDVCPACGVPKTAFEPFAEKISPRRKMIIDANLHPISVHFPQAFATVLPPLLAATLFVPESIGDVLLCASKVMIYLLPFTVIGAFKAGLLDGYTRFKKLSTPALIKKIITGSALIALSIALAAMTYTRGLEGRFLYYAVILAAACVVCEIILGQIGKKLMIAKLPG